MKNKFLGVLSIIILGGLTSSCGKSSFDMSYVNEKGEKVDFKLEKTEDQVVVNKVIDFVEYSNKDIDEFSMKLNASIKGIEEGNEVSGSIKGDFANNKDYGKISMLVNMKANSGSTSFETNVTTNQFIDYSERMIYSETIMGEINQKVKESFFGEPDTPELDDSVDSLTNAKISKVKDKYFIIEGSMDFMDIPGVTPTDGKMNAKIKVERKTGRILSITSNTDVTTPVKMNLDLSIECSYDKVSITPLTDTEKSQYKFA